MHALTWGFLRGVLHASLARSIEKSSFPSSEPCCTSHVMFTSTGSSILCAGYGLPSLVVTTSAAPSLPRSTTVSPVSLPAYASTTYEHVTLQNHSVIFRTVFVPLATLTPITLVVVTCSSADSSFRVSFFTNLHSSSPFSRSVTVLPSLPHTLSFFSSSAPTPSPSNRLIWLASAQLPSISASPYLSAYVCAASAAYTGRRFVSRIRRTWPSALSTFRRNRPSSNASEFISSLGSRSFCCSISSFSESIPPKLMSKAEKE